MVSLEQVRQLVPVALLTVGAQAEGAVRGESSVSDPGCFSLFGQDSDPSLERELGPSGGAFGPSPRGLEAEGRGGWPVSSLHPQA